MSSEAQILANRANAALSTGPRTAKGKARSARNAAKHRASSSALLVGENRAAFKALRDAYLEEFRPTTESETFLVASLTSAAWRLNRLAALEPRLVSAHYVASRIENREEVRGLCDALRDLLLPGRPAPPPRPDPGPEPYRHALARDRVARAYIRDSEGGNTITKLARYQTSLERSYYRALHELQRLRGIGFH